MLFECCCYFLKTGVLPVLTSDHLRAVDKAVLRKKQYLLPHSLREKHETPELLIYSSSHFELHALVD